MVDHSILLKKLEMYKCEPNTLNWFKSYLSDRQQFVTYKGASSSTLTITDGVPQGSILGPLLFLVFINDLPLSLDSHIDLFADDTTLMSSSDFQNLNELQSKLSSEVSNLTVWAKENCLPINHTKTKTVLVSGKRLKNRIPANQDLEIRLEGTTLDQVSHAKLLGLEIDEELSFDKHVESISLKLAKRIGVLKRVKSYLPTKERILFFNTLIKPVLTYCDIIWTNCSKDNLNKIFKLQKLAARVILDAQPRHSSVDLFNKLGWVPFYVESDIRKCCLALKRIKGETPQYLNKFLVLNGDQHKRITRNSNCNFIFPKYKREMEGGRSISVNIVRRFSKLPLVTRNITSLKVFRKHLLNYFINFQMQHNSFTTFMDMTFK